MPELTIRSMTLDDVEQTIQVQLAAFADLAKRQGEPPLTVTDIVLERTRDRHRHFITHDPEGAWVATSAGKAVGCALALRRDGLWGLSLLVVDPASQSTGAGRALLDASLRYAEGCDRAIILSSTDPRAMRAYGTSGFDLFPQVLATGRPLLAKAPMSISRVRDGGPDDWALAESIDRHSRGAARGPDHAFMTRHCAMYVVDDAGGSGYMYLRDAHVYLLVATNDATATDLLWRCFAGANERDITTTVEHITGEQQWAITACLDARLDLKPGGPVFWRGSTPPRSYLPSGAFL